MLLSYEEREILLGPDEPGVLGEAGRADDDRGLTQHVIAGFDHGRPGQRDSIGVRGSCGVESACDLADRCASEPAALPDQAEPAELVWRECEPLRGARDEVGD